MIILVLLFTFTCSDDSNEQEIDISQIPQKVLAVVQDTLLGFEVKEANVHGETMGMKIRIVAK